MWLEFRFLNPKRRSKKGWEPRSSGEGGKKSTRAGWPRKRGTRAGSRKGNAQSSKDGARTASQPIQPLIRVQGSVGFRVQRKASAK